MRKFHFDVALQIRKCADLHHATDRILARFLVCDYEHLTHVDGRGHSDHGTLREHDHGAGLFFERLGVRRDSAHDFSYSRAVNFDWDFEGHRVSAQVPSLV
jgi:hypothetical protein